MLLNLNDPESILAWWRVLPERHDSYLDYKLKASPEFAPAILEAQRRIAGSPELCALLANAAQRRRQREAAEQLSAYELRYREFAAA